MEFKPYSYQQRSIQHILDHPAAGLLLDMGMGKTVSTLTAVQILMYERFEISKVLVIATKRVAESTWTEEAKKWDHLHELTFSKVLGTCDERVAGLFRTADIYLINRENVTWLVDYLGDKWPFDMIVIDELSSFKSTKAKRFRALKRIRPLADRVVGLTGTPASNGFLDLWPEVYLLDRGKRLGKTITRYKEHYFQPGRRNGYVVYEWNLSPGADQEIMEKLSDICISMQAEDYLELPECQVRDVKVQLPAAAEKAYRQMEREKVLELESSEVSAFQAAAVMGKLLQMANGAVYDDDQKVQEIHKAKIEAMDEILEAAQGQPVLCFYSYKHDLTRLQEAFKAYEPRTLKDNDDIKEWNEGRIKLLLAHPASAGHGLNLQSGGHIIVWFGLPWSLELYEQANARLYRQGQKQTVIIHRILAENTVDELVAVKLEQKGMTQNELLEALKARNVKGERKKS